MIFTYCGLERGMPTDGIRDGDPCAICSPLLVMDDRGGWRRKEKHPSLVECASWLRDAPGTFGRIPKQEVAVEESGS